MGMDGLLNIVQTYEPVVPKGVIGTVAHSSNSAISS
jgi:4'-phosphopantetheinyl transferase EntD